MSRYNYWLLKTLFKNYRKNFQNPRLIKNPTGFNPKCDTYTKTEPQRSIRGMQRSMRPAHSSHGHAFVVVRLSLGAIQDLHIAADVASDHVLPDQLTDGVLEHLSLDYLQQGFQNVNLQIIDKRAVSFVKSVNPGCFHKCPTIKCAVSASDL